jgi:hypothetical protein
VKKICVFVVLFGMCALAEDKTPASAKEAQPQNYSYTDAQGIKWTVRHTPFAVLKLKDSDMAPAAAPSQANPVTVTDLGDSIRFERNYPFGHNVWTTKKSELNEAEKGLLAAAANTATSIPQGQASTRNGDEAPALSRDKATSAAQLRSNDKTGQASSPGSLEKK